MSNFTIENFWRPLLGAYNSADHLPLVQGWSFEQDGIGTFLEAPLTLSSEFGQEADPSTSSILLVSAPGAVGKSTLARQVASITGSIYVDLSKSDPVAGNFFSGGLARSHLFVPWTNGELSVLIDGLDEALLRTTKEGFEAFVNDVAALARGRSAPTVLFGRTGVVEDVWIILDDAPSVNVAVLEIGYYGPEASIEFADATLKSRHTDRQHPAVDKEALRLLLDGLRNQTESDGDRFAGYAPVLQAVAERVASETNPSNLVSQLTQGQQEQITLQSVVRDILKRERGKLEALQFQDPLVARSLYSPDEQLDRLVSHVYSVPPPELPAMCPEDRETYSNALENWVAVHPFLGGGPPETQSAVFQAVISARGLKGSEAGRIALQKELGNGDAANPFLYIFYMDEEIGPGSRTLQEEHIGCFYSSLRASLAHGESGSLTVEELEDNSEEALVEMELYRASGASTVLEFNSGVLGPICLGAHVKDITVNMPQAVVEIGQGSEAILVAPIEIQCNDLVIDANRLIAQCPPEYEEGSTVILKADILSGMPMSMVPVTRGKVELLVSWPGVNHYPWNSFAAELKPKDGLTPHVLEGLRRFRRFIIAFRAHGRGRLAKSGNKMESGRMTKGGGQEVLEYMLANNIASKEGSMYFLNTGRLAEMTGATYVDLTAHRFGEQSIEFVRNALGGNHACETDLNFTV